MWDKQPNAVLLLHIAALCCLQRKRQHVRFVWRQRTGPLRDPLPPPPAPLSAPHPVGQDDPPGAGAGGEVFLSAVEQRHHMFDLLVHGALPAEVYFTQTLLLPLAEPLIHRRSDLRTGQRRLVSSESSTSLFSSSCLLLFFFFCLFDSFFLFCFLSILCPQRHLLHRGSRLH